MGRPTGVHCIPQRRETKCLLWPICGGSAQAVYMILPTTTGQHFTSKARTLWKTLAAKTCQDASSRCDGSDLCCNEAGKQLFGAFTHSWLAAQQDLCRHTPFALAASRNGGTVCNACMIRWSRCWRKVPCDRTWCMFFTCRYWGCSSCSAWIMLLHSCSLFGPCKAPVLVSRRDETESWSLTVHERRLFN